MLQQYIHQFLAATTGLLAFRLGGCGAQLGTVAVGVIAGVGLGRGHPGTQAAGLVAAAGNTRLVAGLLGQVGAVAKLIHTGLGRGLGGHPWAQLPGHS